MKVRLKEIAEEAGVSTQTVSLALRGHKRISEATRSRIQAIADRLGYRSDPAMSALAHYRTQSRSVSRKWDQIALVSDWHVAEWYAQSPVYRRLRDALINEAKRRGFSLKEVWLGPYGAQAKERFRSLRNQGISGVISAMAASGKIPHAISFPNTGFQVVTFGPESIYPDYHTVQFDFYENQRLVWRILSNQGAERVGLVYLKDFGWRTGDAWLGCYLAEKQLAGFQSNDLEPCILESAQDFEGFNAWRERARPDAIVTPLHQVKEWCQQLKLKLPVANLSVSKAGDMGIDVHPEAAARAAIELLVLEMQRQLVSESSFKMRIHIPGRWTDAFAESSKR